MANVKALDQLVGWVARRKGGRTVVGQAVDAGREIFATALLPDRKLRWLGQQPLGGLAGGGREGERRLLLWTLEDALKQRCAVRRWHRPQLSGLRFPGLFGMELCSASPLGAVQMVGINLMPSVCEINLLCQIADASGPAGMARLWRRCRRAPATTWKASTISYFCKE